MSDILQITEDKINYTVNVFLSAFAATVAAGSFQ